MKITAHVFRLVPVSLIFLLLLPAVPAPAKTTAERATDDSRQLIETKADDGRTVAVSDDGSTAAEEGEDMAPDDEKGAQFKFKGQVKNLYLFHRTDNFMGENPLTMSSKNLSSDLTRLRLSPEFLYGDILTARLDLDNELIWSNYGKSRDFTAYWRPSEYNDFLDLSWEPYRSPDLFYRIKLHRAYVKLSVDKFTATVGRQQIRFGSGKLWNPLDILNPVSPTFVEGGDEQKGTDAVRFDIYPQDRTEITIVADFKKSSNRIEHFNMQDCNYILRVKTSVKDADLAVLGGYVSRRGVAGVDFAAILFDGMLRGSVMVCKPEKEPVFFQANAGYEYTFKAGVFILGEYFFNQKALNYDPDLKAAVYRQQVYTMNQSAYLQLANQFLTVNQHYLALALGYDFHPLVRGELFTIGDIQGRGIFWGPTLRVNAYENLDFTVGMMGAFVFDNKSSDFSEYRKNYMYYASGSYVF